MVTFEYRFYPKTFEEPEIDLFDDAMQWFVSVLVKNGQALSVWQNNVKFDNHYAYRLIAPRMDSLAPKYWNKYCRENYEIIMGMSAKEPELLFIGENYDVPDCCDCEFRTHYIMYTSYITASIPIICGDCHKPVPLYELPKTYYDLEYYDLLGWERAYHACDTQFMEGIGGRHGYYMMHNPKSALSQSGLELCGFLEEKTGMPFYYFLFTYGRNRKKCPLCGREWKNTDIKKYHYDFVCHACRIVSNDIP